MITFLLALLSTSNISILDDCILCNGKDIDFIEEDSQVSIFLNISAFPNKMDLKALTDIELEYEVSNDVLSLGNEGINDANFEYILDNSIEILKRSRKDSDKRIGIWEYRNRAKEMKIRKGCNILPLILEEEIYCQFKKAFKKNKFSINIEELDKEIENRLNRKVNFGYFSYDLIEIIIPITFKKEHIENIQVTFTFILVLKYNEKSFIFHHEVHINRGKMQLSDRRLINEETKEQLDNKTINKTIIRYRIDEIISTIKEEKELKPEENIQDTKKEKKRDRVWFSCSPRKRY